MTRMVLRWLDSPLAFELTPGLNTLGRNPTNDFRISDPSLSSFHAELTVEGEKIRVRDLGSTNGTFIDEQRIQDAELLDHHVLRLGNVRLQLEEVTVVPIAPPKSDRAAVTTTGAILACSNHPDLHASYRCENCTRGFCHSCITVMGQSKFGATTICPVCGGQCYELPEAHAAKEPRASFLGRLTQTLKIPFTR
jgi:pSer/pThr/pTyr-binding forkhead associated (FHA) protein